MLLRTESEEGPWEVIVVGGGHAGCEAALAAARLGARTLLLNLCWDNTALMACNPSVGGPAKGHLVREVDVLGGHQALAADASTLHLRMLNTSKGPSVRALRAQCDPYEYQASYREACETCPNLEIRQERVESLRVEGGVFRGLRTRFGETLEGRACVLATGTYLGGRVHVGMTNFASGPLGQPPALALGRDLAEAGFEVGRLKTGTTPRILSDGVDWEALTPQESDSEPEAFSALSEPRIHRGHRCALTRSLPETHRIIRENLDRSPLFTGVIEGVGPRYCPSIEDKVVRFPDKESHPVFLEPFGRRSREVYMQNFSTSLPLDVQRALVRSLPGCGRARILRPGYAIEYDYLDPLQLWPWLETKRVRGLFCAGQINGTSGYEEAAAQGLLAGANAVLRLRGEEPLVLGRDRAYAGVLVDDLTTKGTREPYRMLTSRCEYRLLLRCDNADERLAPLAIRTGLLSGERAERVRATLRAVEDLRERVARTRLSAGQTDRVLEAAGLPPLREGRSAAELLLRPEVSFRHLAPLFPEADPRIGERIEADLTLAPYAERQRRQAERLAREEETPIPEDFDYGALTGLLAESRIKLARVRPRSLGQAMRISGVVPGDLMLLAAALRVVREGGSAPTEGEAPRREEGAP